MISQNASGSPYSAMQESIHSQTLADGTHIERKGPAAQIYRDSQGRIREEFYSLIGPPGAQEKFLSNVMIIDPVECVEYNLHVANRVAGRRSYSLAGTIQASHANGGSNSVAQQVPRAIPEELRPRISVEQLGTETIEGLAVEGKRTIRTIPVGGQGNDRPMVVTAETWTSPDLKITVLTKTSDPRSGEHITRLTNIERLEPDPALFRVPADYKIQDEYQ
jgi:hypothetical protein